MTPRGSWLMVTVILVAQMAEAAPRDSGPPPDADFLEFLGSWQTGDGRWVDPFYIDEVPTPETGEQDSASRRPEAGVGTKKWPTETTHESNRKGTDVTVPRRDVKP